MRALKRLIRLFSPHLIFLQETRLKQSEMDKIRTMVQYAGLACVDCSGRFRSGGLAILWNSHYDITLQSFSQNHIDTLVADPISNDAWRFTGLYGYPNEAQRHKTWELLQLLYSHSSLPWLCAGDFNDILYNIEKK